MSSRYQIGDTVEVFGQSSFITDKRHIVSKGIGTIIEIRGGDYYSDYTNPRIYIVQLEDRKRICSPSQLKLVRRKE